MRDSASMSGGGSPSRSETMPAIPHMRLRSNGGGPRQLFDRMNEEGPRVEVRRRASLRLDVTEDAVDLLGGEPEDGRDLRGWHPVVVRVEAKVHAVVREREVELLLRLRH